MTTDTGTAESIVAESGVDEGLITQLIDKATAVAKSRRLLPLSTYRLQLNKDFPLAKAIEIVPYLESLGISHIYASPVLAAKEGSNHGYDICDHSRINPELGTEEEFRDLAAKLQARGMGLILDAVPNHMCVAGPNAWWYEVLENGPSSPYAGYFDIAWHDHPRERLHGKVLLPILGEPYGQALENGQFKPIFDGSAFAFSFGPFQLPADPRTYAAVLVPAVEAAKEGLGEESDEYLELQSVLTSVRHLPSRDDTDADKHEESRWEIAVIKRRLGELTERSAAAKEIIETTLQQLAGTPGDSASFAELDAWLEAQPYRPCFWRVASDEINYRRFFDINDLAAISVESEEVFRASHAKWLEWLAEGVAQGLRIDHPDGLYDPKQYLDRLQTFYLLNIAKALSPELGVDWATHADQLETALVEQFKARNERPLYVVVEKILSPVEPLPPDWATDGTTGYEFINNVNGLFVESENEAKITDVYRHYTGLNDTFDELVYRKKFLILQTALSSELHMLAHQLDRLAQLERWSRDFTLNGLRHALREVIACFPVYRSYITSEGYRDSDKAILLRALKHAKRRNPLLGPRLFNFIRDTLLLRDPPSGPATEEYRAEQVRFAGRFQQVTSPVMAKGLEDTSLYIYNRMTSLNEVGNEPSHFGTQPAKLHDFFHDRAESWPGGLSPLSTHDNKRSEDVRARINVLSEMPEEWGRRLARWSVLNGMQKTPVEDGLLAPDANEEYLLYQTILGAWPGELNTDEKREEFTRRISEYMNKALHEAKVNSSWINPDQEYDDAVATFVRRILDPELSGFFLDDLKSFMPVIAHYGVFNSLSQSLIRCTAPGVPDTYQGTEVFDFSLVDPDNRRPVDYQMRADWLRELDERAATDLPALLEWLLANKADGRIKLYVISRALRARKTYPDWFRDGAYEQVKATGLHADHLFAFARSANDRGAITVAPRLLAELMPFHYVTPLGGTIWKDTALELPPWARECRFRNLLTGEEVQPKDGPMLASQILSRFPVALLIAEG